MAQVTFHPDALRKRFHDLGAEREKIMASAQPLRSQRDGLRQQQDELRNAMRPIEERLKAIEAPLYDIDVERSAIVKALSGKTGKPD